MRDAEPPRAASRWMSFLSRLRSWQLLALVALLFVLDIVIPDPIPFVDEILLGLLTLLLARWKGRDRAEQEPPLKNITPGPRRWEDSERDRTGG